MKIHEFQAKGLFRKFEIPVPRHIVCNSDTELKAQISEFFSEIQSEKAVVKAQIHAGGRGKAGGVRMAKSVSEAVSFVTQFLGSTLVTHQTGPEGSVVNRVLVEEPLPIASELYAAVTLDRSREQNVVIVSASGGMDIEKVAAETPEAISKIWIDPLVGLRDFQIRYLLRSLGLSGDTAKKAGTVLRRLVALYEVLDCSMAEINPLVVTQTGDVVALDAKLNFDDNALFRQPDIRALEDPLEEDPAERTARENDLNFIKLTGNVGCIVNGAGLAMATMDIIKQMGSDPANFLDVGGKANVDTICKGFQLILQDTKVNAILINIFGGIVRCDLVANGILEAVKQSGLTVPIVVRLEGTNAETARAILKESNLNIISAGSLASAASKVVAAAQNQPISQGEN